MERAILLARQADIIGALSAEALRGTVRSLHPSKFLLTSLTRFDIRSSLGLHASRPHPGQNLVAQRLRALLHSPFYPSAISESHANCGKVQDAYSIRCIPQVISNLLERVSHSDPRSMESLGIRSNSFRRSSPPR